MKKILVMNGPNLNLTGTRKKNVYGAETLEDINRELAAYGEGKGVQVDFYQSNHEGALIDKIHASRTDYAPDVLYITVEPNMRNIYSISKVVITPILASLRFLANANTKTIMPLITRNDNCTTILGMSFETSAKCSIEYSTGLRIANIMIRD